MHVEQITDKKILYEFFKKNLCLFDYHIGDLDDFFFKDCIFFGLLDDSSANLKEVCLVYQGLKTPTVLALGITDDFFILLEKIIPLLPEKFFCHFLKKYEEKFCRTYFMVDLGPHFKMYLQKFPEQEKYEEKDIILLNSDHKEELLKFYSIAYPDSYFESYMLDTGYYFGLQNKFKKIISVAGLHTFSKEYRLAVLGNIATHPDFRGGGYSHLLISYLISQLEVNVDFIGLNVKADNINAIKLYEHLAFTKCTDYQEAFFEKKEKT